MSIGEIGIAFDPEGGGERLLESRRPLTCGRA